MLQRLAISIDALLIIRHFADLHGKRHFLTLAPDHDIDLLADLGIRHIAREFTHLVDLLTVELHDDVTCRQARTHGRAILADLEHQRTARFAHAQRVRDLFAHFLDLDAEPVAMDHAILLQLLDHRFRQR